LEAFSFYEKKHFQTYSRKADVLYTAAEKLFYIVFTGRFVMSEKKSFLKRHKVLSFFFMLLLCLAAFVFYRMIGPHRFYCLDFVKTGNGLTGGQLMAGVAKRDITPDLSKYDIFNDVDNDNKYSPKTGLLSHIDALAGPDTFTDRNNNGKFDAVWMTGFNSDRPAKGVHDPIDVRALALRNNGVTVVLVTLDAIGMFHDKVIDIRKRISADLGVDHVIVSCLHNHETPDTMGIYSGPVPTPWTFDAAHMEHVMTACVEAAEESVKRLQPVEMYCVAQQINPDGFVMDTRKPIVIDTTLNCVRFVKPGTDETIAVVVNWSNHPEALGGRNPYITADFCGYWRKGVENGVPEPNGAAGMGGMCLYFQGMVGGLMTPLDVEVPSRDGSRKFKDDSFEKAEALGDNLAVTTLKALRSEGVWKNDHPRLAIGAKTIYGHVQGGFCALIALGLIHPGVYWPFSARSEVDVARIGDVEIATVPGELYPEIADGGEENPAGADYYPLAPVETPPLRKDVMEGRMRMVIGLANDEIGYIIPKSQWDSKPPRAYEPGGQYGEDNSCGPDLAPVVYRESAGLLRRLHDALK
jgi:hypothetical protein